MRIITIALILTTMFLSEALQAEDYGAVVSETPGLVAHWRFEETIDPRLEPEKRARLEVDEEALRGLFFPGGSSLKISARVHDAKDDFIGRTEEVKTGQPGVSGKCFQFDGKDSLVYLFRDPSLDSGVDDFSFELWVKPENVNAGYMLLHKLSPLAKGNGGIYLQMTAKGALSFAIVERQDRSLALLAPEGTISPGKWSHIVALRRGPTLGLFVDGKSVKEETGAPGLRIPDYGDIVIGGTPWDRRFPGLIDEVAYYSVALSVEEIEKHFRTAGFK